MAKKSALSKGFRKAEKKKPFLTKSDIKWLIGSVVVILLAVLLFNLFYDDGYLGAKEVQPTDLVYYAEKDLRNRYMLLGTVNEMDGFTIEGSDASGNGVILRHNFIPTEPIGNLSRVTISGSYLNAAQLAAANYESLSSFDTSGSMVISEIKEITVQGHPAYMYMYTQEYYLAEDQTMPLTQEELAAKEPNTFTQRITTYVNIGEKRTVCMYIDFEYEDNTSFFPFEDSQAYVDQYSAAFTLLEPEAE